MGFGLMLCGYFILTVMAFGMGTFSFGAYLVGGLISLAAAKKLYAYKHRFGLCIGTSAAYMALAVYGALNTLHDALLWDWPLFGDSAQDAIGMVTFLLELLHTAGLLWATAGLASSAGAESVRTSVAGCSVTVGIWAVGQSVLVAFPPVAAFQDQTIKKLVILLQLAMYLVICWFLFKAYRYICPVDETDDGAGKRSRIPLVARIQDGLEERANRALRATGAESDNGVPKKKKSKKKKH